MTARFADTAKYIAELLATDTISEDVVYRHFLLSLNDAWTDGYHNGVSHSWDEKEREFDALKAYEEALSSIEIVPSSVKYVTSYAIEEYFSHIYQQGFSQGEEDV